MTRSRFAADPESRSLAGPFFSFRSQAVTNGYAPQTASAGALAAAKRMNHCFQPTRRSLDKKTGGPMAQGVIDKTTVKSCALAITKPSIVKRIHCSCCCLQVIPFPHPPTSAKPRRKHCFILLIFIFSTGSFVSKLLILSSTGQFCFLPMSLVISQN